MKFNSIEIKSKEFKSLLASAPEYDPATGLGKKTIGSATFLFAKDENTGKIVCYSQSRGNANARFVARVEEDKTNDVFHAYYSLRGSDCTTVKLSSLTTDETKKIGETINNEGIKTIYTSLNPYKFSFTTSGAVHAVIPADVKIAQIEIPNKDLDTQLAYIVVSKHPTKAGKKSWYILKDGFVYNSEKGMLDKNCNVVNLEYPEAIFAAGGYAIHKKVQYDKNGAIRFKYYTDGGTKHTKQYTLAHQSEVSMAQLAQQANTVDKVKELKPTVKTRRVLKIVAPIIAAAVVLTTLVAMQANAQMKNEMTISNAGKEQAKIVYVLNQNEARQFGAMQMKKLIDDATADGSTLLNYKTNGKVVTASVGKIYEITKNPLKAFEDDEIYTKYYVVEDENGVQVKLNDVSYLRETVEGAYGYLGSYVAKEAAENGMIVATRVNADSDAIPTYYYAVDPSAPSSAISSATKMISYLTGVYNDEGIALDATAQYEYGFKEKVNDLVAKDGEIAKNDEEINRIDFEAAEVKAAVVSVLRKFNSTKTARSFEDDELNISYASSKGKVVYINTIKNGESKYLYKIDLSKAGEIKTVADFEAALAGVTASDLTESINLDVLLKKYDLSEKIEAYKKAYAAENGMVAPIMFVANHKNLMAKGDNEVEIASTLIAIGNNGAKITETEMTRVSVAENKPYSINAMNAVSIFGSDLEGIVDNLEIYSRRQVSGNTKTYENNEIPVAEVEKLQFVKTNEDGKGF